MIDLQRILNICNYFVGKEMEGNTLTPSNYNDLLPKAVNDTFNLFVYKDFDKEQRFTDASLPFKVFMGQENYIDGNGVAIPAIPPLMIDANGYANIPSDYKHYSAINYKKATRKTGCDVKISFRDVYVLTDQQFNGYANSSLESASYKYPICNFQKGFIRFLPKDLSYVNFVYLKQPITPVYAFTINSTTQQVIYNQAGSTQVEFRDEECFKLINILLSYVGVNLSLESIVAYTTQEEQKGIAV